MEDEWLDQLVEDLNDLLAFSDILEVKILEDRKARETIMKNLSLMFLKVWMRFAIDLAYKMKIKPEDHDLGMYEGKNFWRLNKDFDFSALDEIVITNDKEREHSLKAECYQLQGREHVRLLFSLEEGRSRGKSVMVNYLVYSALAKDFDVKEAVKRLKPGLGKWYLALAQGELSILWNYCRDKYELVGV